MPLQDIAENIAENFINGNYSDVLSELKEYSTIDAIAISVQMEIFMSEKDYYSFRQFIIKGCSLEH